MRLEPRPVVSPKRLPLDFAKIIAHRRANRVAAWTYTTASNNHMLDIQRAIDAENRFNERHRLEDRMRLGGVPAHVTRPILEALLKGKK
jgi:hypothetical protein